MNAILDKMYLKRFCLPVDSDIDLYESGINNVSPCMCGHYNHVSCIFQGKGRYEKD
jgi:hypothetical protein